MDQFQYAPWFYAHASLIRLDLGIGIHTYTARMSAWGGSGELYHYSVFALLEFYWNVHVSFFKLLPMDHLFRT